MRVPLPSEQCFFTCAGLCLFGLHTPLPHQAYANTKIARTYAYRKPTQSYAYITVARQKPIQILVRKIPTQSLRKPGQNQCQAKRSSSAVQLFSANYYFNFQASIWLQKMLQMIDLQNPHTLELNLRNFVDVFEALAEHPLPQALGKDVDVAPAHHSAMEEGATFGATRAGWLGQLQSASQIHGFRGFPLGFPHSLCPSDPIPGQL